MINQISRELPHQYILREDLVVHFSAELSMVYKSFTTIANSTKNLAKIIQRFRNY